jgi:hypothetical protein
MHTGMKETNPKQAFGDTKLPLHLWPETATIEGALACLEGKLKYGRCNWREAGVLASTYYAAARRHLIAWFEGEETAADSGVSHLGHALACLAILVDAKANGKLIDDRQYAPAGGYLKLAQERAALVPKMIAKYADNAPKHYDRRDDADAQR